MPRVIVRCMVCSESIAVDFPSTLSRYMLFDHVARYHDWQTTCMTPPGADSPRLFICCPQCIPWAYDAEPGTRGRLRPEAFDKMVP
jgi:hypothetical protein